MKHVNKRRYESIKKIKERGYHSYKSDNYVLCKASERKKYLYSTISKALTAVKFTPGALRPYFCKACNGYHITSESKDEFYGNLAKTQIKRYGTKPLKSGGGIYGD